MPAITLSCSAADPGARTARGGPEQLRLDRPDDQRRRASDGSAAASVRTRSARQASPLRLVRIDDDDRAVRWPPATGRR
jgi:hypothetical protein